jgi:MoaA/NifB/PqqE/SkfB family radical SAM enzyme
MRIYREETEHWGILFDTTTMRYKIKDVSHMQKSELIIPLRISKPRIDILSAPVRTFIELTQKCNLQCEHCFASSSSAQKHYDLKSEMFLKLLDQLRSSGVIGVCFTGGEPTVRDDWYEIIKYAKELNFAISLNTNGVYSDPLYVVNKLIDLDLDLITVSLDGLSVNHNQLRGDGTFKKTLKALELMTKENLSVRINCVVSKLNITDIHGLVELASSLVEEINFYNLKPIGRAKSKINYCLSFEENYNLAVELHKLRELYPEISIRHFGEYLFSIKEKHKSKLGQLKTSLHPYGNSTLSISSDGGVWPHGFSPYQSKWLRLGEFQNDNISDIWFFSEKLETIRKWLVDLENRCKRCNEYMVRCIGQNFEMEIARITGQLEENPYCISTEKLPYLADFD